MTTVNKSVIKSLSLSVSRVAGSGFLFSTSHDDLAKELQSHQHLQLFIADQTKPLCLISSAAVLNVSSAPHIDSSELLSCRFVFVFCYYDVGYMVSRVELHEKTSLILSLFTVEKLPMWLIWFLLRLASSPSTPSLPWPSSVPSNNYRHCHY